MSTCVYVCSTRVHLFVVGERVKSVLLQVVGGRDGVNAVSESERGRGEQDQERQVGQRVCNELGCRTAHCVADLDTDTATMDRLYSARYEYYNCGVFVNVYEY